MRRRFWLLVVVAGLLASCNLAGDVTPPPGATAGQFSLPTQSVAQQPVAVEPPTNTLELDQGEAIYQERCAPCHGLQGQGDGEQASDLPLEPTALGSPELAQEVTPAEWYRVVTEGRMNRFMPPFTSLSDQQRWNVVAYALTLSYDQAALDEGEASYQQYCADCHGADGAGGGGGPSLVSADRFAELSRSDLAGIIGAGVGNMPAFDQQLDDGELRTTAAFVQSLAMAADRVEETTDEPEQEPQAEVEQVAIQGQLQNGTDDQLVGADIEVTLFAFDGQEQVFERTVQTGPDGGYTFDDVEPVADRLYVVGVEYQGVRYSSEVLSFTEGQRELQLPITVFETTSDPEAIRAGRVHFLIDPLSADTLRVVELWVVLNQGQRTIVPGDQGGVQILLPEQAADVRFEDSLLAERYNSIDGGFQLAEPLRPGGEGTQIVFSYQLPFEGTSQVRQPLTMPVEAVTLLVSEGGPRIEGDQVVDRGTRQAGGEAFHQYDILSLTAGDDIAFTVRGPSLFSRLVPQSLDASWAVGAAVFVLALAAIAWWYRPWLAGAPAEAEGGLDADETMADRRDWLLTAIAELDAAFDAGKVDRAAYQRRRSELKSELIDIMQRIDD